MINKKDNMVTACSYDLLSFEGHILKFPNCIKSGSCSNGGLCARYAFTVWEAGKAKLYAIKWT